MIVSIFLGPDNSINMYTYSEISQYETPRFSNLKHTTLKVDTLGR